MTDSAHLRPTDCWTKLEAWVADMKVRERSKNWQDHLDKTVTKTRLASECKSAWRLEIFGESHKVFPIRLKSSHTG
jgi:hypothetical protein